METKKRKRSGINVGSSLILVTFILLCLVAFAALSFISANSDYELSKQTADKTTNYYNAASTVEQYLAELDSTLKDIAVTANSNDEYSSAVQAKYADESFVTVVQDSTGTMLTFVVPINQSSGILVALNLKDIEQINENDASYDIAAYQTITTTDPDVVTIQDDGGLIL